MTKVTEFDTYQEARKLFNSLYDGGAIVVKSYYMHIDKNTKKWCVTQYNIEEGNE